MEKFCSILDLEGNILSNNNCKNEDLKNIYEILKDVKGFKEKIKTIIISFESFEYNICYENQQIYILKKEFQ